jgi:hypothetical protein
VIAFLITLLMAQGIPALPGQSGTVSGVVRTSAGTPAAGVRVSAMVPPDAGTEAALAGSFAALAQTDEQGRYRLEGIPQGRYYIVAGRVDLPTFYPGTADMTQARIFSVASGGAVSGIDFVMMDTSVRSASAFDTFGSISQAANNPSLAVKVNVAVEGGAKLPIFGSGAFTGIRFTDVTTSSQRTQLLKGSFSFSLTLSGSTPEYRVQIENLPEGYIVKSMTYGTTDVLTNSLKIPSALIPRFTIQTSNGVTVAGVFYTPVPGQTIPELNITLAIVPLAAVPGVRVTGRIKDNDPRGVYLSGTPGILFSDGTYEFRGVSPGRHSIAAFGAAGVLSLGASIVVGDRDLEGVLLDASPVLPRDVNIPKSPGPAGTHSPGSVLPFASIRGRIVEEASGTPIAEGTVRLIGRDSVMAPVGTGGEFEFTRLLPGTYELEVRIFGHSNVLQPIVIGDEDLRLDVKTLRLY